MSDTRAVSTGGERRRDIDRIAALPAALAAAVAGLSEAQLDTLTAAEGWTIRQVVHHVADSHMNAYVRVKLLLTEEQPTVRPYDQEAWATLPDGRDMPLDATLRLLAALHERWVYLFASLDDAAWPRGGHHPEGGPISVAGMLRSYAQHGEDHVAQIGRIRAALGVGS